MFLSITDPPWYPYFLILSLFIYLYINLSQAFIYFIPIYDFLSVTIYAFVELSFVRASFVRFGCL